MRTAQNNILASLFFSSAGEAPSVITTAPIRKNSFFSNRHITGFVPGCVSLIYYYETLSRTMNSQEDVQ